jgi:CMP/dCMP kinase
MTVRPCVVALDGPAGAGKSTVAKLVAVRMGFALVDTGAIYRTLAMVALADGVSVDDEPRLTAIARTIPDHLCFVMDGDKNTVIYKNVDVSDAIRAPAVSAAASAVARHASVRAALLELQRTLGRRGPGAVLEGRDIGTVVFPDAAVKAFVTASVDERARRRLRDMQERDATVSNDALDDVKRDIAARDAQDSARATAPLLPAADAHLLDTTGKSLEAVVDEVVALIRAARSA